MKVLAIDPGAERLGWAVLQSGPKYIDSGLLTYKRIDIPFQHYRCELENYMWDGFTALIRTYHPDLIVNEILPAVGGGNFVGTQSYLVNVVVSILHAVCISKVLPYQQVAARSVQSKIATKGKAKKISKVRVRNGVVAIFPELKPRIPDWIKVFDECDAIAVGLYSLLFDT